MLRQEPSRRGAQIGQGGLGAQVLDLVEQSGVVANDLVKRRVDQRPKGRSANVLEVAVVLDDVLREFGKPLRIEKVQAGGAQRAKTSRLRLVRQQLREQVLRFGVGRKHAQRRLLGRELGGLLKDIPREFGEVGVIVESEQ